jgi:hypothetical protein
MLVLQIVMQTNKKVARFGINDALYIKQQVRQIASIETLPSSAKEIHHGQTTDKKN